jgi:hypothetical protein
VFDAHKNFAYSKVAVAPVTPLAGVTLTLEAGTGGRFPATAFNAVVCPAGEIPLPSNAEVVRATIVGDVATIERKVEGSTARAIIVGDQFADAITVQNITDIEAAVTAEEAARVAADAAVAAEADGDVAAETVRAEAAEAVLEGEVDTEEARALAAEALLIPLAQKDAANGVAGLDAGGLIEEADLPASTVTGSQRTATSTDAISSSDHVVFYDATGSLPPTNLTVAAVGSGGTFAKAIYFWKVTAIGGISGESVGSNEVTVEIILNGSATLKWSAVAGATGYKVYRAALPGMEIEATSLVATLGNVLEYTDTGIAAKAGHTPATNGGAFTATLPTAVGYTGMLTLEAISAGLNLVTLATTGGQTIEGSASGVLTLGSQSSGAPYRAVTLVSDTANWRIV